jgi:hypothetical protein
VKRTLVLVVLSGSFASAAALAASGTTTLHARLSPVTAASTASGSFVARATTAQAVRVRWRLSVTGLTGRVRRTKLTIDRSALAIALCAPCRPKARGEVILTKTAWRTLLAKGAHIIVATRAHPKGELRGVVRRG